MYTKILLFNSIVFIPTENGIEVYIPKCLNMIIKDNVYSLRFAYLCFPQ